ncbi:MAG: hypothetical protein NTW86_01835 [Candidatus Sumerlaeota bacterium]|nr:hypothetical protein [Candidatus Sumerlaeota bacterium]
MFKMHYSYFANRRAAPLAAGALFVTLAALSLREEYWADEGFTVRRVGASWAQLYDPFARPPASLDPFDRTLVHDLNPPLYFAVVRLLAGASPPRWAVRAFSFLPAVAVLPLAAAWAKRRLGSASAAALPALYAASPAILFYGVEARPYAMPLALILAAMCLTFRHGERPGRTIFLQMIATAATGLMNFQAVWWAAAWGLALAALWKRPACGVSRRGARGALAGMAVGGTIALAALWPQRAIFAVGRAAVSETRSLSLEVIARSVAVPLVSPPGANIPLVAPGAAILCAEFALALALLARSARRAEGGVALTLWLAPTALPILARWLLENPFYERYCLFAFPGWLMTSAWVAQEIADADPRAIRGRWARRCGLALAGAAALVVLAWCGRNAPRPTRPPWRPAIETLLSEARSDDRYVFDPPWLEFCFAANAGHAPSAAYLALGFEEIPDAGRVWVIGYDNLPTSRAALEGRGFTLSRRATGGMISLWEARRAGS